MHHMAFPSQTVRSDGGRRSQPPWSWALWITPHQQYGDGLHPLDRRSLGLLLWEKGALWCKKEAKQFAKKYLQGQEVRCGPADHGLFGYTVKSPEPAAYLTKDTPTSPLLMCSILGTWSCGFQAELIGCQGPTEGESQGDDI